MNKVAEEINALMHYGMPRRSGRYPYGSGKDPYQRTGDFLGRIELLKKDGWTETPENIMKEFGMTTTQYRAEKSLAKNERRALDVARAQSLKEDGLGYTEIGRRMGIRESTVRSLLDAKSESRMKAAARTADELEKLVKEKGMIDVGAGVERELNISKEKLNQALTILKERGYPVWGGRVSQGTSDQKTTLRVLCPPGTEHKDIFQFDKGVANIHSVREYISRDGGDTIERKFAYPASMDSKRMLIRYKEDGGIERDGLVEIRRGVQDLSLGNSRYSQVRILVDGTHYIKGMAVYSDNMPDGVDVVFNTNKPRGTPPEKVLKEIKADPDNPFGSLIKDSDQGGQYWYTDAKTGEKKLGLINKRADEGDWEEWSNALPSQFLSKQSLSMAKKQLGLAIADKEAEYDEICSLTNPTVKKHLLAKFADECDSAAVHLKAAALPGQKYHVIIPINTLKDNEVYAPGYDPGTQLALIRYPHGGTFEIPILRVTHKNQLASNFIGKTSIDGIGVNSKVAERLSGADFDGDTVMCIPTHDKHGRVKITSTPALKDLEGFDPKVEYGPDTYAGRSVKLMRNTGTQMGIISNLITDMTLAGAPEEKLARAVRHSMVVIDAEKHGLDYKKSEADHNIAALKAEYQRSVDANGNVRIGGASTLISRAKGQHSVDKRKGSPIVNIKGTKDYDPSRPEGALIYKNADDLTYEVPKVNKKTGEVTYVTRHRKQQSTRMAETDDAYSLVSEGRTKMELEYAAYANKMKDMANQARKEAYYTTKIPYSAKAKETYADEVRSLLDKLDTALRNAPRERQAQIRATADTEAKIRSLMDETPGLTYKEAKKKLDYQKTRQRSLSKHRDEVGSVSRRERSIKISDREWEAIQAGAVSENKLKQILNNTDVDNLRERATPRSTTTLSGAKVNRIKAMSASNYSISEIANALGVSTSTVASYLKGVK